MVTPIIRTKPSISSLNAKSLNDIQQSDDEPIMVTVKKKNIQKKANKGKNKSKRRKNKSKRKRISKQPDGRKVRIQIDCSCLQDRIAEKRFIVPSVDIDYDKMKTFIKKIYAACPSLKNVSLRSIKLLYDDRVIKLDETTRLVQFCMVGDMLEEDNKLELDEIIADAADVGHIEMAMVSEQIGGGGSRN